MIFNQINSTPTPTHGRRLWFRDHRPVHPARVFVNPVTSEIWVGDNTGRSRSIPIYQNLQVNSASTANVEVPSAALALTQDQYGDLIVADATNRVGFYFPAADAVNGGNFLPSCMDGPASTCRPLSPGVFWPACVRRAASAPRARRCRCSGRTPPPSPAFPTRSRCPLCSATCRCNMSWTNADGIHHHGLRRRSTTSRPRRSISWCR